jgi:hypothetical protein
MSDERRALPSRHEMRAAMHRRHVQQQQLAVAVGHTADAELDHKTLKKVAAKASGFGVCAIFGIACS